MAPNSFKLLLFAILFCACNNEVKVEELSREGDNAKMIIPAIANALQAKYNEEFALTNVKFDRDSKLYNFSANPTGNQSFTFVGKFDNRKKDTREQIIGDSYPNDIYSHTAGKRFERLLNPLFKNKKVSVTVFSRYKHPFGKALPTFETFLEDRSPESVIRLNAYLFDIPSETTAPVLTKVKETLQLIHSEYSNNYCVFIGFFPTKTSGITNSDSIESKHLVADNKGAKIIYLKVVSGSISDLSESRLYELIEDYNPDKVNKIHEV